MSPIVFRQTTITPRVQEMIFQGLQEYGKKVMGFAGDHLHEAPTSFEAWDADTLVGALVLKRFWGQLHLRSLYVNPHYRRKHVATMLMEKAFIFAKNLGCQFIFVETLHFQALTFYKKMGFQENFVRHGYAAGVSFHYLQKDLTE